MRARFNGLSAGEAAALLRAQGPNEHSQPFPLAGPLVREDYVESYP
jgi:hypothetical protein